MRKLFAILLLACLGNVALAQRYPPLAVDSNGAKLKSFYLSLDVEHLWLKGHHVNWQTGMPDRNDEASDKRTHCSRFVAAACMRHNIYIARPPQLKPTLMANAQFDWLATTEAKIDGWVAITDSDIIEEYYHAQQYADEGYVTVAVYKNEDPRKPGHIAFVTPTAITYKEIKKSGPMLTQAGHFNANATPLRKGFEYHITSWPEQKIRFYYNSNR